ncbi:MAG TPA: TolC family protein, partial [Candidatus Baltobacteraceae bacterium]|nr:TolC family protein [Candidatus Baltobacteraceae bacterium]
MRRVLIRLAPLAVFAVAAFVAPAAAQPAKTAPARATQSPPPAAQPTPYAVNTLPPAAQAPLVPYPAYGSPVPGVTGAAPPSPLPPTVSLDQAEAIGFELSPLLTQARGDVGVQAALVRIDAAGLLPNLQGTASTSRTHNQRGSLGSTGGGSTTRAGIGDFTANSVGADISQLIYDGGRVAAGVKAAQHSETSSADTYRRELQTVANNVAQAYYAYLATERAVQAALEIVREDVVQEDLVRAQVRAGTAARSDIATAQLPTAQARLAVVRAQGAEFAAQAAFANAMGLDAGYN